MSFGLKLEQHLSASGSAAIFINGLFYFEALLALALACPYRDQCD